jgi:hypothetical protein
MFLAPCPHRELQKDQKGDIAGVAICKAISEAIGHSHGIYPETCARCCLSTGQPNPEYISKMAGSILLKIADRARLGFYQDPKEVESIFQEAFKHIKEYDGRKRLSDYLEQCVELGRLPLEVAEKIAKEVSEE